MTKKFKLKIALLSLPAIAGFLVFYIIPFFRSIGYSFISNAAKKNLFGLTTTKKF